MTKEDIKYCPTVCNEAIITDDNFHYYCIDDFIKDLQTISADKRKLPLVMFAPNGTICKPQIKMVFDNGMIFNDLIAMSINYR